MKCFICKGEYKDSTSTFMAEIGKSIIVVKEVPSQICSQCGEVTYNTEVVQKLERIVESMKTVMTEFAVVHYPDVAA